MAETVLGSLALALAAARPDSDAVVAHAGLLPGSGSLRRGSISCAHRSYRRETQGGGGAGSKAQAGGKSEGQIARGLALLVGLPKRCAGRGWA